MPVSRPHTVTFDCWSTLIYEPHRDAGMEARSRLLAQEAGVSPEEARGAIRGAWREHQRLWRELTTSGASDMARWALESLGVDDPDRARRLSAAWEEATLDLPLHALDGAGETLEALAGAGVRRGLVCDTGFSPGRVVRLLLERAGLLDHLEVLAFSDEVGVPKPHPQAFAAALDTLGVPPVGAVHVGDLRRTDVAGGRAAGMGTVRISWWHDDDSDLPEADAVAESHAHLRDILGLG